VQFLRDVNNVTGEHEESFSNIKGLLLRSSFLDAHRYARSLTLDRFDRVLGFGFGVWVLGFGI